MSEEKVKPSDQSGEASDAELQEMIAQADTGARSPTGTAAMILVFVPLAWSLFQLWYASPLPFMLKFAVAHPAVTVACPGTGNPEHMIDNLGGGRGRLPTEEHVRRMIEWEANLPAT